MLTKKQKELSDLLGRRPKVTLPEVGTIGRYVQLYVLDKPLLRCGVGTTVDDTGSILDKALEEFKINPQARQQFRPGGEWYPVEEGRHYKVVGSGDCLLKRLTKRNDGYEFLLSMDTDGSRDYPLGVDWGHLSQLRNEMIDQNVMDLRLVKISAGMHIHENLL